MAPFTLLRESFLPLANKDLFCAVSSLDSAVADWQHCGVRLLLCGGRFPLVLLLWDVLIVWVLVFSLSVSSFFELTCGERTNSFWLADS